MIKKDDFINVIFDNFRGIQASQLLNLINLLSANYEEFINFGDFMKLLQKFGDSNTEHL